MSQRYDGCGRPVGHADEIVEEYKELGVKVFGEAECKRIFEDANGVEPCVRCDNCSNLVKKSEIKKVSYSLNGSIMLEGKIHPDCEEEFYEKDRIYTPEQAN